MPRRLPLLAALARSTGIKVNMSLKGSGEALAQLIAEKANPKTDLWFGGTGDPHLQAAEGLRVHEGAAQEHRPVHALGHRADQGGGARRDHGVDQLRARRPRRGDARGPTAGN